MPLFVWVQGMRGPEPQIITEEQVTGEGKDKTKFLQKHVISEQAAKLGTAVLASGYPYKGGSNA